MDGTFYPKNDYRNYLEHHGVKGMHWGVRKSAFATGVQGLLHPKKFKAHRDEQRKRAARRSRVANLERKYYSDDNFRQQINKQYGIKDHGAKTPYEQHDSGEAVTKALYQVADAETLAAWNQMGGTTIAQLDKRRLR